MDETTRRGPETVAIVMDRTYEDMAQGVEFERWPGEGTPSVGDIVCIFDLNYDFTQHAVIWASGQRVRLGAAIPWPDAEHSP